MISIARKGRYVVIGLDNLKAHTQKLYLLLVDKNAGKSLSREMHFMSEKKQIPLIEIENLSEIIEKCKAVGIKNKAISESIVKMLKGE